MSKLKLMTIIGTRPDIIKLSEIIKKADTYFEHILVHTGQNYDYTLNQIFFEDLGLREPDFYLECAGDNLGQTMGNVIEKSYNLMLEAKPDALLVLGDTNSSLCTISAKRLKIPIFHLEAGNRSFDENLPEEINRRIVDHISDVNLTYSEHARRYLLSEGVRKEYTFKVGSPMAEVISNNLDTAGLPDPDLLIRTSGEQRLSNYLLWQLAYTEFYFTDVPWPDFHKKELEEAVRAYNNRERRFGALNDEE